MPVDRRPTRQPVRCRRDVRTADGVDASGGGPPRKPRVRVLFTSSPSRGGCPFRARRRDHRRRIDENSSATGEIALRSRAAQVVEQHGFAVARGFGQPHVARDGRLEDLVAEVLRDLARTWFARFMRPSNIVNSTPSIVRCGLYAAFTFSIVAVSADRPSSAKYSACIGTTTPSAATSALSVSRPSDGGQSIDDVVVRVRDRRERIGEERARGGRRR